MATFDEFASGGVGVGGISNVTTTRVGPSTKFDVRGPAYIRANAERGKLSIIYIKKIICHQVYTACPLDFPGVQFITIYTDTLNAVFFEAELVTEAEAKALAIEFWEDQLIPAS